MMMTIGETLNLIPCYRTQLQPGIQVSLAPGCPGE